MIVYLSSRAHAWSAMRIGSGHGPGITGPGLGFLPIFSTREEAVAYNPECNPTPIEVPQTWIDAARPSGMPTVSE